MHIYFLGIGGAGIGPLAQIAKQAGYNVSGSDKVNTSYIDYLKKQGINDISISDDPNVVRSVQDKQPIDWLVYSSAVAVEDNGQKQLETAANLGIKCTKRDEFINYFIKEHDLKMLAVAGTHGKTTTTAMIVFLCKQLNFPISYLLPAKVSFGEMGHYQAGSKYFIYEADEYDRNFLSFNPDLSVISGLSWDHHEIYPTKPDYNEAFQTFINQSLKTIIWSKDAIDMNLDSDKVLIQNEETSAIDKIKLDGMYNRRDAWLSLTAVSSLFNQDLKKLVPLINEFPGLSRRMEEIYPGLYSDYAHTPDKIRGAMSAALDIAASKPLVVVYEPLTNRRQTYMIGDYKDCFKGAKHVLWLPSYLAREDPNTPVIPPSELISHLSDPSLAEATERNQDLIDRIKDYLAKGYMVVGMAGGGGGSLDEWLRLNFKKNH